MQNAQNLRKNRVTAPLAMSAIVVIGFGLILGAKPLRKWLANLFVGYDGVFALLEYGLEHLGVATIVAIIVWKIVEEVSQREFLDVLRENLDIQVKTLLDPLTYKITRTLGDNRLKEMLEKRVLNPDFMRSFLNLTLKLTPLRNPGVPADLLECVVISEYEVRNISDKEMRYEINSWLEDIIELKRDDHSPISGFTKIQVIYQNRPHILDIAELERKKAISRKEGVIELQYPYDHMLKPNERLHVIIEGLQIMRKEDHFIWNLSIITEKMDISVELSGGLNFDGLNVHPREMNHIGHEAFSQTWDNSMPNILKMNINEVLLPYQGVEIRWASKPVQQAAAPDEKSVPATHQG